MIRESHILGRSAAFLACCLMTTGARAQEEHLGQNQQALVGGALVDAATREEFGLLKLMTATGGYCSASMLNDYWAITAAHCVTGLTAQQITLTADWPSKVRSATALKIVTFSNDVALLQTGLHDFTRPDARERPLFKSRPMANLTVHAFGCGINAFATATKPSVLDGRYRSADFDISSVSPNSADPPTFYSYAGGAGVSIAGGDSGGPSYILEWDDPLSPARELEWQLAGVHSSCGVTSCSPGKLCGGSNGWQWVTATDTCADASIMTLQDAILDTIQELPPDQSYIGRFDSTPIETSWLYAVRANGELLWYRSDDRAGQKSWQGPNVIGWGWDMFSEVIGAGGNRFYGRTPDGSLLWYQHNGFNNGEFDWKGAIQVGSGWNAYTRIFAGGNGVIYAVAPDGYLYWYRHYGFEYGGNQPGDWAGRSLVGSGWTMFQTIFSAGNGVIYGIKPDGTLVWYRHRGVNDGSFAWDGPVEVGWGWQNFTRVFSGGNGVIYAVQPDGTLLRYKHLSWNAKVASFSWDNGGNAQVLGTGWQDFRDLFTLAPMDVPPLH